MKEVCFLMMAQTFVLLAVSANLVLLQTKCGYGQTVMKIIARVRKDDLGAGNSEMLKQSCYNQLVRD
jgi:hypothetical protein